MPEVQPWVAAIVWVNGHTEFLSIFIILRRVNHRMDSWKRIKCVSRLGSRFLSLPGECEQETCDTDYSTGCDHEEIRLRTNWSPRGTENNEKYWRLNAVIETLIILYIEPCLLTFNTSAPNFPEEYSLQQRQVPSGSQCILQKEEKVYTKLWV
jgi:hypothetical protein